MTDMADGVYMTNEWTHGAHWFPNEPDVIAAQEARGWVRSDPPEDKPFHPDKTPVPETEDWVRMYHDGGLVAQFPNNAEAIAGAQDSGWTLDEPQPEPEPEEKPEPKSKSRSTKTVTTSEKEGDES